MSDEQTKPQLHAMIDIETLSTRLDAVVASIGVVHFNADGIVSADAMRLNWQDQLPARRIDKDALLFWLEQPTDVSLVELGGAMPTGAALIALNKLRECIVWGNGAAFDLGILKSLFESREQPAPWSYKNERCYRTARRGRVAREPLVAHDPVEDARAAALDLIEWGEVR